ncbi:myosin regulatory light chain 2 isoform X3 [Diabrotica virgifera virgifera]|uniref:Myosin regulatory light chain 2 isoform X1 n=1 Tax=Diabrotica virgifera virgifera TaxID=50390 RepID=A0A6P7G3W8_DIAVI|nr:myosin regulatory light chain 2 isoform X2 [Diabrotica virgifera virgifera]XP_028139266.1 myosin regulatory light chain 2 isoform X3 [Diabrotica virgifera virgifera]
MADKEKKVKKKKKEEGEAPAAAPAPAETRSSSKSSSKKAKRSGSNVFSMFSQSQVAEFKEAFQLMDHDKDGIISKSDLRATFDAVGKLASEKELDEMINEAPGPINFTQLLGLFGTRMADSGGTDDDEVVVKAFRSFDENGTIDGDRFRHALMTWGEKFTGKECDDAFDAMDIDDNNRIDTQALITLLTAAEKEEGEEGEAA